MELLVLADGRVWPRGRLSCCKGAEMGTGLLRSTRLLPQRDRGPGCRDLWSAEDNTAAGDLTENRNPGGHGAVSLHLPAPTGSTGLGRGGELGSLSTHGGVLGGAGHGDWG